jgi:hypothetical protein
VPEAGFSSQKTPLKGVAQVHDRCLRFDGKGIQMMNISMKSLLEAGVHFGHQTRLWNPKMAKYIYGSRNNIHIIDLSASARSLLLRGVIMPWIAI